MVFNDKVFDNQAGLLKFDLFNTDGIFGDKFLVNGMIQPVLHVSPRRYRFRWLNTGPSRFYQLFVLGPNNSTKSFWQISTDGNLLEKPVQVNSSRFSVAERVDVIVDFTNDAGKTFISRTVWNRKMDAVPPDWLLTEPTSGSRTETAMT